MTTGAAQGQDPQGSVLARYARVVSRDLDEVRDQVGRVFCEHRLNVAGRATPLDTRLYYRPLRGIGIGRMSYGATVDIDPGMLRDFYLLQVPLRGQETVEVAGERVWSTAGTASFVSPGVGFRMQHGQGTEKLFLRVERAALEQRFVQLQGRPLRGGLTFAPGVPLDTRAGDSVRRLLAWLAAEASDGLMLEQPLAAASVEDMVLTTLLDSLPHNQGLPWRDAEAAAPRCLRRARDYMAAHIDEPISVGDIAAQAGVSSRSLYLAFRKHHGTSPMAWLRELRLERVRAELQNQPGASVTSAALRWGFTHLGQFSAAYRRRFGELPSQTLARAPHPAR